MAELQRPKIWKIPSGDSDRPYSGWAVTMPNWPESSWAQCYSWSDAMDMVRRWYAEKRVADAKMRSAFPQTMSRLRKTDPTGAVLVEQLLDLRISSAKDS